MEFEEIKALWNHSSDSSTPSLKVEEIEGKLSSVLKQRNKIKLSFRIELYIIAAIYVGFVIMVLFFGKAVQPYMFKMVAVVTILGIPVVIRLYKSIQWRGSPDYSRDNQSYLMERVNYLRKTLRIYRWSSYGSIILTAVVFFTDASFNRLPLYLKSIIVAYLALYVVFLGPYIKKMYGDKIAVMEEALKE